MNKCSMNCSHKLHRQIIVFDVFEFLKHWLVVNNLSESPTPNIVKIPKTLKI